MKKLFVLFILGLLCLFSVIIWEDVPKYIPFGGMAFCGIAILLSFQRQAENKAEYTSVHPLPTLGEKQPIQRKNKKKISLKKYLPILFLISAFALIVYFFVLPTFKPPRPSIIEPVIGIGILIVVILTLTLKKPKES